MAQWNGAQAALAMPQDLTALARARAEDQLLLEGLPDLVALLDRDGGFLDIHGQDPPDLAAGAAPVSRFSDLMPASKASEFAEKMALVLEKAGLQRVEFSAEEGGMVREYEARLSRVLQDRVLLVLRDVSERNRSFREVVDTERMAMMGRMAAGMAHEIRNPLSIIYSMAQLLELEEGSLEPAAAAARISAQCQRIESIVRDALGYAREGEEQEKEIAPSQLLQRCLALAQLQFGPAHSKVRVVREFSQPLAPFKVRQGRMEQVFINLLMNAYQALEQGGTIRLRAAQLPGGGTRIEVEDDGPGVRQEHLERIFEPFFTTKRQGSGLGLPICRRLVEEHRGSLTAELVAPRGVRFVVSIPGPGPAGVEKA